MLELLKDLLKFFGARKKYWLIPIVIVLIMLGVVLIFGGGSALAPFIYTIF